MGRARRRPGARPMMKVSASWKNGRRLVMLGLSHANLDRLRKDGLRGYIEIKAEELHIGCDIIITAAETEQVMMEAFAQLIGEGTEVKIDERLKS
jgi:hypothetical protein